MLGRTRVTAPLRPSRPGLHLTSLAAQTSPGHRSQSNASKPGESVACCRIQETRRLAHRTTLCRYRVKTDHAAVELAWRERGDFGRPWVFGGRRLGGRDLSSGGRWALTAQVLGQARNIRDGSAARVCLSEEIRPATASTRRTTRAAKATNFQSGVPTLLLVLLDEGGAAPPPPTGSGGRMA
jgi:hypothetical protein